MRKSVLTLLLLLSTSLFAVADEGMWLPSLIGKQIHLMQSKGLKITAEDIYSVNQASLKDAIVHFNGGCTGELISSEGLLITNHHCGFGQIQSHSSVEHDYLTDGFWAMNRNEELPNPGLYVKFLKRMEDVTAELNDAKNFNKTKAKILKKASEGGRYKTSIEKFYYGNQYFLFVYEVFNDVRLVGAPPSSIGKFGGDTDNWMWPRHTGDFSLFRVYANKDNKPASYSKDNIPYQPKQHFKISTKGVEEGDFSFVYGYPGTTWEYVISDDVDFILNDSNPVKIALRTMRLEVIGEASEKDKATRIKYAAKQASIANAWKKWQGQSKGLARLGTIGKKQSEEAKFQQWANNKTEYKDIVPNLKSYYAELKPYAVAYDYYNEAAMGVELIKFAASISGAKDAAQRATRATPFFKNYDSEIDRNIAKMMLKEYTENLDDRFIPEALKSASNIDKFVDDLFASSALTSADKLKSADDEAIKNDPAVVLAKQLSKILREQIAPTRNKMNSQITAQYKSYMQALMEYKPDHNFYPDANSTLRIAYGKVGGYEARDGVYHRHYTTLDGIIEKDNPEIYDYNIPQKLRDVYASKDFGKFTTKDGKVPVAFIASNHTTGGNSGSPVINGNGELIGVNFDRTWLSTMSDLEFDPSVCRNIALDIRYMLFVVDKIGNASYLIDEMDLVE